jgi:methylmalonyl-CoA/ethylmalonyl-CoA epimerase
MRISHVGIAVKNWEDELQKWKSFTGLEAEIEEVPEQGMRMAIFNLDNAKVELIGSTSSDSPVAKFLEKRGTGMHHICFSVDNIENKIEEAKINGLRLIDQKPRIGSGGHKIAFFHPKAFDGVLIEISD